MPLLTARSLTDLESGLIVEANPAACRMHGYTRDEFIGLQLITCVHPESQYAFSESIQVFQADGVFDLQTLGVRRDGSTFMPHGAGRHSRIKDDPVC